MTTTDTYLAVFLGSKTNPRMKAWMALPEAERRNVSTTLIQPGLKFRLDIALLNIANCVQKARKNSNLWIYGQRKKGR